MPIIAYLRAAQEGIWTELAEKAPVFVLSSMIPAMILPLDYIALGSLGLILGFFFGNQKHHLLAEL